MENRVSGGKLKFWISQWLLAVYVIWTDWPSRGTSLTESHFEVSYWVTYVENILALAAACKLSRPSRFKTYWSKGCFSPFHNPSYPQLPTAMSSSSAAADPAVSHEEHVQDMPIGQRVSLEWRPEAFGWTNVFERNMSQQFLLLCEESRGSCRKFQKW